MSFFKEWILRALAHFQSGGKVPLFSDLLNKIDSGTEINSIIDLIANS